MILRFPSIEAFQLALASGVVRAKVQCAPARLANTDDGALLIEPSCPIDRVSMAELVQLGVDKRRSIKAEYRPLASWHEAIELVSSADAELSEKTEVLFDVSSDADLVTMVAEMLRLGNDRQSFRHVVHNGVSHSLLRVISPPYYTMLRALESDNTDLRAYVQQSPRVWVQVGFEHPLGQRIKPFPGQWLLISAAEPWLFLAEGPFRDVYDLLEFPLPAARTHDDGRNPPTRISVPLTLSGGDTSEAAELWILHQDAIAQTERLVRRSDDQLLSRLAFAVCQDESILDGQPVVIIRVRPSKLSPPVLVLDSVACRAYLKIPNLFVPVGQRLHPPLRRPAVAKLLAEDGEKIYWLLPHDDGSFTPHSIPDAAFRPLSDWIDYVLDHDHQPLQAWVASHRFDFESFVCGDQTPNKKPNKKHSPSKKRSVSDVTQDAADGRPEPPDVKVKEKRTTKAGDGSEFEFLPAPAAKPKLHALQLRLRQLEAEFQSSDDPPDSPSRSLLWKAMAVTNAALEHGHDATLCWSNAMWDQSRPDLEDSKQWLRCEQHCGSIQEVTAAVLARLISDPGSRSARSSLVASFLIWAAAQDAAPASAAERLSELTQFLTRKEDELPIRAAWMAWCAIYKLSGKDVLLLARARSNAAASIRPRVDS